MTHVLIVEDDADSADMMAGLVAAEGFSTATAGTLRDARARLAEHLPDLVLVDLGLPDGNGMELFDAIDPNDCEIVLVTGNASLETSIQALRLGAADYLIKPVSLAQLRKVLARAGAANTTRSQLSEQQALLAAQGSFGRLWGRSQAMQEVYRQIARVAPTAVSTLITGESGTGKELAAQTIHELSKRGTAPFLAVNCGAIAPQLIESELFGHEKGSFTGAVRQHCGYFERADCGTLFLDEVTEMPLELQVKLLRVLETGMVTRVGADTPICVDVRILAATNRLPLQAVQEGRLREDLYYRLGVFVIDLPPLRERAEDIPLIAMHFLAALNMREKADKHFSDEALRMLRNAPWPGNVRELRNAVHRGFILAEGQAIDATSLPPDLSAPAAPPDAPLTHAPLANAAFSHTTAPYATPSYASSAYAGPAPATDTNTAAVAAAPAGIGAADRAAAPGAAITVPGSYAPGREAAGRFEDVRVVVGMQVAEAERLLILATLRHCGGHRERAATMLGISTKTLYNRLKEYQRGYERAEDSTGGSADSSADGSDGVSAGRPASKPAAP